MLKYCNGCEKQLTIVKYYTYMEKTFKQCSNKKSKYEYCCKGFNITNQSKHIKQTDDNIYNRSLNNDSISKSFRKNDSSSNRSLINDSISIKNRKNDSNSNKSLIKDSTSNSSWTNDSTSNR